MAYLKGKRVKGRTYFQILEAYWEGGRKRERVLLHLGTEVVSPQSLLRWWDYLGQPRIPYKPGCFRYVGIPSLATPCETIPDLNKFLSCQPDDEALYRVVEGLKFLMR